MGKGDRKTKTGKRFRGSYGKTRPRKERNKIASKIDNIVSEKGSSEEE